jgi:hypothetical protein
VATDCSSSGCQSPAFADIQWSTEALGSQVATFCKAHMDELWAKVSPLVQIGKADIRLDKPGALTGAKVEH